LKTIVSLIASATEIACELGLRDQLVGRSHECDYPPDVAALPILSAPKVDPTASSGLIDRAVRSIVQDGLSVYSVRVDELERLKPDLILTQDHCEVCAVSLADVEDALCRLTLEDTAVCSLHPNNLEDVKRDFRRVADAAEVPHRGAELVDRFTTALARIAERAARASTSPTVALVEWIDPPMVAGGWMPELARIAGGTPLIVDSPTAFKTVTWDEIATADPDVMIIVPCGFGVQQTLDELADNSVAAVIQRIPATGRGQCYVADGNAFFNRPGPRLVNSAEILGAILHPTVFAAEAARHRGSFLRWPVTAPAP
jgi:iron complex transport system substrate-binding protein